MPARGQSLLEYLLLMSVVVFIALAGFKGGIIPKTIQTSNEYFKTGTRAVLGGYYDTATGEPVVENPLPVSGQWCAWSACINGYKVRQCACPRPAFGGAECSGDAVSQEGCSAAVGQ